MSRQGSLFYEGHVFHQRYHPKKHRLSYRVFSLLIDLDDLEDLDQQHRLFSYNRWNIISLWDKDFGARDKRSLPQYVRDVLVDSGREMQGGSIRLLCYPRLFGYVFNPLSVYYCYDAADKLRVVLYEVSNTFGERHTYLIDVDETAGRVVRQTCEKEFHVSPFMGMEATYRFRLSLPDDKISVLVDQIEPKGIVLRAHFSGQAKSISDRVICHLIAKNPLMTLKVIVGIHWEALKLWSKGVAIQKKPNPPSAPITIVQSRSMDHR